MHGQKRRGPSSDFGIQLAEKRKLEASYFLDARDLKKIFVSSSERSRRGKADIYEFMTRGLEMRLDSIVYRMGFAPSRSIARQLVSHGHCYVNGRKVDAPSFMLKPGDVVSIKPSSISRAPFGDIADRFKKHTPPPWIELDRETFKGKVAGMPIYQETPFPADLRLIVAYYSR